MHPDSPKDLKLQISQEIISQQIEPYQNDGGININLSCHYEDYLKYFGLEAMQVAQKDQKIDLIAALEKQHIFYDGSTPHPETMIIHTIQQSLNREIITIRVSQGPFQMNMHLLNMAKHSSAHSCQEFVSGSFGKVYFTTLFCENVAIKCFQFNEENKKMVVLYAIKQWFYLKIASALKTGPAIKSNGFDIIVFDGCIEFMMESCEKKQTFSEDLHKDLLLQLTAMHTLQIVHLDIKPSNICFSPFYKKYVFIDFGFTRYIQEPIGKERAIQFCGTIKYCSKQMLIAYESKKRCLVDLYYNDAICLANSYHEMQNSLKVTTTQLPYEDYRIWKELKQSDLTTDYLLTIFKFLIYQQHITSAQQFLKNHKQQLIEHHSSAIYDFIKEIFPTKQIKEIYYQHFQEYIFGNITSYSYYYENSMGWLLRKSGQWKSHFGLGFLDEFEWKDKRLLNLKNDKMVEEQIMNAFLQNGEELDRLHHNTYFDHYLQLIICNKNQFNLTISQKIAIAEQVARKYQYHIASASTLHFIHENFQHKYLIQTTLYYILTIKIHALDPKEIHKIPQILENIILLDSIKNQTILEIVHKTSALIANFNIETRFKFIIRLLCAIEIKTYMISNTSSHLMRSITQEIRHLFPSSFQQHDPENIHLNKTDKFILKLHASFCSEHSSSPNTSINGSHFYSNTFQQEINIAFAHDREFLDEILIYLKYQNCTNEATGIYLNFQKINSKKFENHRSQAYDSLQEFTNQITKQISIKGLQISYKTFYLFTIYYQKGYYEKAQQLYHLIKSILLPEGLELNAKNQNQSSSSQQSYLSQISYYTKLLEQFKIYLNFQLIQYSNRKISFDTYITLFQKYLLKSANKIEFCMENLKQALQIDLLHNNNQYESSILLKRHIFQIIDLDSLSIAIPYFKLAKLCQICTLLIKDDVEIFSKLKLKVMEVIRFHKSQQFSLAQQSLTKESLSEDYRIQQIEKALLINFFTYQEGAMQKAIETCQFLSSQVLHYHLPLKYHITCLVSALIYCIEQKKTRFQETLYLFSLNLDTRFHCVENIYQCLIAFEREAKFNELIQLIEALFTCKLIFTCMAQFHANQQYPKIVTFILTISKYLLEYPSIKNLQLLHHDSIVFTSHIASIIKKHGQEVLQQIQSSLMGIHDPKLSWRNPYFSLFLNTLLSLNFHHSCKLFIVKIIARSINFINLEAKKIILENNYFRHVLQISEKAENVRFEYFIEKYQFRYEKKHLSRASLVKKRIKIEKKHRGSIQSKKMEEKLRKYYLNLKDLKK